jgi:hypothetical protein
VLYYTQVGRFALGPNEERTMNTMNTTPAAFEPDCAVLWTDADGEQHEAVFLSLQRGWAAIQLDDATEKKVRLSSLELLPQDEQDEQDEIDMNDADVESSGIEEAEEEQDASPLARQMRKYRAGYTAGVNASGSKTLTTGDRLAEALLPLFPAGVCALADVVLQEAPGFHAARYAILNPGQQRMNAGNRIRAWLRKNESSTDAVLAQAAVVAATPALNTPAAA